ncbi:MAG: hypothetical protein CMH46_16460 [Muricauda sp.]|nr:hypothetical protein [Allomuricauda sp.]
MPPARLDVVVLPSKRKHGRLGQGNQEREIRKEWEQRKNQWKHMEFQAYFKPISCMWSKKSSLNTLFKEGKTS